MSGVLRQYGALIGLGRGQQYAQPTVLGHERIKHHLSPGHALLAHPGPLLQRDPFRMTRAHDGKRAQRTAANVLLVVVAVVEQQRLARVAVDIDATERDCELPARVYFAVPPGSSGNRDKHIRMPLHEIIHDPLVLVVAGNRVQHITPLPSVPLTRRLQLDEPPKRIPDRRPLPVFGLPLPKVRTVSERPDAKAVDLQAKPAVVSTAHDDSE